MRVLTVLSVLIFGLSTAAGFTRSYSMKNCFDSMVWSEQSLSQGWSSTYFETSLGNSSDFKMLSNNTLVTVKKDPKTEKDNTIVFTPNGNNVSVGDGSCQPFDSKVTSKDALKTLYKEREKYFLDVIKDNSKGDANSKASADLYRKVLNSMKSVCKRPLGLEVSSPDRTAPSANP